MQTKQCKQCGRAFTPAAPHQAYCGLNCRRRAERSRAAGRDPRGRAPSPQDGTAVERRGYFTTLTNPTEEQLLALRLVYDGSATLGQWLQPSLLVGHVPAVPAELLRYLMTDSDGNQLFIQP